MTAELYILADSFAQNTEITNSEIEIKIRALASDFALIKKFRDTNRILVHPEIYEVIFINNITISDLLNNDTIANENLDRDARISLKKIVWENQETELSSTEVKEVLLPEHDEDICHGLIAFNLVEGINENYQIIYGIDGWYKFRRHFLGLYPKNSPFFIDECEKYFPRIAFHENNKNTAGAILPNFSQRVIFHLSALNDRFSDSQDGIRNRSQVLKHFSINCGLDVVATLEGNASRKLDFTFDFMQDDGDDKGKLKSICCEPHIKLCASDIKGDHAYYQHRIYFYEGDQHIKNNNILVGHIGEHL